MHYSIKGREGLSHTCVCTHAHACTHEKSRAVECPKTSFTASAGDQEGKKNFMQ